MDLNINMGTPFGIDERDGTFRTRLSTCRASCPRGAPGYRIMMDTTNATAGLLDNSTPPQSMLNGVAYDFCFEGDPAGRPGWTQLRTYVTVFRGPHYDDRMNQFLLEQAGSFRRAFHALYGGAHDTLVAEELRLRREREEEGALATAEEASRADGPTLTSGSAVGAPAAEH
jgi:hypothetical protein